MDFSLYMNECQIPLLPSCCGERAFPKLAIKSWAKLVSNGATVNNIMIQGLILSFAGLSQADRNFTFLSLEESMLKLNPRSENVNAGCRNGSTINAVCPVLPSSFPLRVMTVKELA